MGNEDYLKQSEVQEPQEPSGFKFQIVEHLGTLSTNDSGWTLQVNRISYNGRPPKLDLRRFSPNGKMGKGLALTTEEERALTSLLYSLKEKK